MEKDCRGLKAFARMDGIHPDRVRGDNGSPLPLPGDAPLDLVG